MRHGIAGNHFNRHKSWRKATLRDLAKATLIQQRITTTEAKAKESRKLVDKLITLGKKGTLAHKRLAYAILCDHKLVSQLFNEIAPRFNDRLGGYTRIIKLGQRRGDNASMVMLELTEIDESLLRKTKAKKSSEDDSIDDGVTDATIVEDESANEKDNKLVGGIKKMFNKSSKK